MNAQKLLSTAPVMAPSLSSASGATSSKSSKATKWIARQHGVLDPNFIAYQSKPFADIEKAKSHAREVREADIRRGMHPDVRWSVQPVDKSNQPSGKPFAVS